MNGTKQAIANSLKHLLLKKPINRITIRDITEDCNISRMTFYYHFSDIYDLVEWICEEDVRAALGENRTSDIYDLVEWICEEDVRAALGENRTSDTWQQGFVNLLETVRDNRFYVENVYHTVDRYHVERYLARMTEKLLLDVIDEQSRDLDISEENKRYIANFFMYGFIGIVLEWIHHGMRESPEQVARITAQIIHGDFRRAIERLAKDST